MRSSATTTTPSSSSGRATYRRRCNGFTVDTHGRSVATADETPTCFGTASAPYGSRTKSSCWRRSATWSGIRSSTVSVSARATGAGADSAPSRGLTRPRARSTSTPCFGSSTTAIRRVLVSGMCASSTGRTMTIRTGAQVGGWVARQCLAMSARVATQTSSRSLTYARNRSRPAARPGRPMIRQ